MNAQDTWEGPYSSSAQRAVASFLRNLVRKEWNEASQRALSAFFSAFYATIYGQPDAFGLPLDQDDSLAEREPNEKDKKQAVKKLLDKPRGLVQKGLEFLLLAGVNGQIIDQDLWIANEKEIIKQSGVKAKFLSGMEQAGLLAFIEDSRLRSPRFAEMMPALQSLARACQKSSDERLGRFLFACCDFGVLQPGYIPTPLDLYQAFSGDEKAIVVNLHDYFSQQGYKPIVSIGGVNSWTVEYQGNRKIKGSPLFEVQFEDRYARALRMYIKCASTGRLSDLLPSQTQFLQDDFMRRANPCRGSECDWCRNKTTLGPSVVEYRGEQKTLCWYSFGDVHEINDQTVDLIQQYERMHAELAPL